MYRLFRLLRITVEIISALFLTAALAGSGFNLGDAAEWIAALQVVPAASALSVTVLVFWAAVTLVFGRIYCSTICPLGALLDAVARIRQWRDSKHHYNFTPALNKVRIAWLTIFAGLILIGAIHVALILDPYNAYAEICDKLLHSVWMAATGKAIAITATGFVIPLLTLFIVAWMSWRRGRLLCNTVCPVGSALGLLSRYSALHIDIDTDLCTQCGRCRDVCKAECIDLTDHVADQSRCVVCFNCLTVCRDKAIRYTWQRKQLSLPMMRETFSQPAPTVCSECPNFNGNKPSVKSKSSDDETIS